MVNIKLNKIWMAILTFGAGLTLGWILFTSNSTEKSDLNQTVASEKKVWTCSMHPQIRKDEPGQCPMCGMDLIPVRTHQTDQQSMDVHLSSMAMKLANVQTSIVEMQKPIKVVHLNGKVKLDERNVASQSSHIPGRIERLMLNFTGESVKKGQVLAYVYSPELITAQEELFEAQKIKESYPNMFMAAKQKLRNWKLTDQQIDVLLSKRTVQEKFPILSDVEGVVLKKSVNLGDYINKGQTIYDIVDLNRVWLLFDVYESDLPWLKVGNKVRYTVRSVPGEYFEGVVSFIDPIINPRTRVASARVEVNNHNLSLKPEMLVSGKVKSPIYNGEDALIVPKRAVLWTGERSIVYVKNTQKDEARFTMQEIILGPALGDSYIVKSGLTVGQEIVTNGAFSIDAAAQLEGKPSMMNPDGGVDVKGHNH